MIHLFAMKTTLSSHTSRVQSRIGTFLHLTPNAPGQFLSFTGTRPAQLRCCIPLTLVLTLVFFSRSLSLSQTCSTGCGAAGDGTTVGVASPGGPLIPSCAVQYKVALGRAFRTGFPENQPYSQSPRVQMYAQKITQGSVSYYYDDGGTNGGFFDPDGYGASLQIGSGTNDLYIQWADWSIQNEYKLKATGAYSNYWQGALSESETSLDQRWWHWYDYDGTANIYSSQGWCTNAASPQLTASTTWSWVGPTATNGSYENDFGWHTNTSSGPCTNPISGPGATTLVSTTPTLLTYADFYTYTNVADPGHFTRIYSNATSSVTISNLYTDGEFYTNIVNIMSMRAETWFEPNPFYDSDDMYLWTIAYSAIDGTRTSCTDWQAADTAALQRMQFRFAVYDSILNTNYIVSWYQIYWDISAGHLWWARFETHVTGTGDPVNPACSAAFDIPAPFWSDWSAASADDLGLVFCEVDDVTIRIDSGDGACQPGSGPTPCNCAVASGANALGAGALDAHFSLGRATNGSAGSLAISSSRPTALLSTPAGLAYTFNSPGVQVLSSAGQIRQVKAPQTLVDIVTDDPYTYEMRFYFPSQFTTQTNFQGLYDPIGTPAPFVTWTIQNPDASPTVFNRLNVTETRDGTSKTYSYTSSGVSGCWVLDYPGNLREDQVVTALTADRNGYTRTVSAATRVPGGPDQFKTQRVYTRSTQNYQFGFDALMQETIDPDGHPKTTTYSYTELGTAHGSARPLKEVVHSDGPWQYYQLDNLNRLELLTSGLGDAPAPSGTPGSSTRETHYYYSDFPSNPYTPGSGDDGSLETNTPRRTIQTLNGSEVSRSYLVLLPGMRMEIRCQTPAAESNASDNLVTITRCYTNGPYAGRIQSIQNPDGTMNLFQYPVAADGTQTNIVYTGQPAADRNSIVDGAQDVTVLGSLGQMISHTAWDILSSKIIFRDIYGAYDNFNRPQQVTHLDGTTNFTYYGCCGVDSTVDADGVTTSYLYDDMKRPYGSSRLGITSSSVLDSVGRVVESFRSVPGNPTIVVSQSQYDAGGRLLSQTNALGGGTTYVESTDPETDGRILTTTTYPDGGTRIEAFYLDGSLKQVTGTAVHPVLYETGIGNFTGAYAYSLETKLLADGTASGEWVKTYTDMLGRTCETLYPDRATSQSFYNEVGQLWKEVDPDGVTTLYTYNAKGEQDYTIQALSDTARNLADYTNLTDVATFAAIKAGTDRMSHTANLVGQATLTTNTVRRTLGYVWTTIGSDSPLCLSTNETSADGLRSWSFTPAGTNQSRTVYAPGGFRYTTNVAPDNSYSITAYQNGLLAWTKRFDSQATQISGTSYAYDPYGRQNQVTDARNSTSTVMYNNADLVVTNITPNPGTPGASPQVTATFYNQMLQATNVLTPDGTNIFTEYFLTGELKRTYGARTYPVAYTYDYAGRMATMTTWTGFAGGQGPATTTWNYDSQRGWLNNKRYADSTGPDYTYTPAGRLSTRTWARNITSTYTYDNGGSLWTVSYDDGITPGVTTTYDRLGRQATVLCNGTTTTFTYSTAGQLVSESYSGGVLGGLSVTNGYDQYLRRTNLIVRGSSVLSSTAYGYDAASRLKTVGDGTNLATYSYLANSPLVSQIAFANNGTNQMTTTKQYDYLNRLIQISSAPSVSPAITFSYLYNSANQRIAVTNADNSRWIYQYDPLGQVISGKKYWFIRKVCTWIHANLGA